MTKEERATGTQDQRYNLISVLYHCLQAAETTQKYINDGGDPEVVQFLKDAQAQQRTLAERAKVLLRSRLT